MKNLKSGAFALLIAAVLIAIFPTEADAGIYEDTVRLHILAASDSEKDQALKYEIRDKLLEKYGAILSTTQSPDAAEELARELLPCIECDVQEWIHEGGFDYSAEVTLTEEWYETRVYEDFALPKGYYCSLRVIIGGGEGKNWWCVMYPPLCTELATGKTVDKDEVDYTREELSLIKTSKYNIKFKTLEIFSEAFRKK